jgi:hypothetical protein
MGCPSSALGGDSFGLRLRRSRRDYLILESILSVLKFLYPKLQGAQFTFMALSGFAERTGPH